MTLVHELSPKDINQECVDNGNPLSLQNDRCFSDDTSKHSRARRRNPSAPKSSRPTFTAMYISRSFCRDLDLIGQTFDQLQLREKRGSASREETR